MSRFRGSRRLALLVGLSGLTACSVLDPKPDTSRYFLLRPLAEADASPALDDLVLGVGPVTVPDYLDRAEMLDLVGPYELRYSGEHRWIEPLGAQLSSTLGENLQALLRPDAVVDYPWFPTEGVTLQVEVTFDAVRLDEAGGWLGSGDWVLRRAPSGAALERSRFSFDLGRGPTPPDVVAQGLSEALRSLGTEIAEAVRRHHGSGSP